jgi:hypothetical protein
MSLGRADNSGRETASKRRMPKNHYSQTEAQRAKLFAACNTPEISLHLRLLDLRQFSELAVKHARELARAGQKDEARIWFRFVCNSKIVGILDSCGVETHNLSAGLKLLGLECHPLDVPSFTTDLEAIHHCLKVILSNVKEKPLYNEPVSRFNGGGSGAGRIESEHPPLENLALFGNQAKTS